MSKFTEEDIDKIINVSKTIVYDFTDPDLALVEEEYRKYYREDPSYFKLLTATAKLFPDSKFLELGTFTGASALAYKHGNPSEPVVTYDIQNAHRFFKEVEGIDFRLGDCTKDKFDGHYDIIFLDISHNGTDEIATMKNFEEQGMLKDCIIFFDDIILNEEMKEFWHSLGNATTCPMARRDITEHGHLTGTGICIYD